MVKILLNISNGYEYTWGAEKEEQPQASLLMYSVAILSLYRWRLTQTSSTCEQSRTFLIKMLSSLSSPSNVIQSFRGLSREGTVAFMPFINVSIKLKPIWKQFRPTLDRPKKVLLYILNSQFTCYLLLHLKVYSTGHPLNTVSNLLNSLQLSSELLKKKINLKPPFF